MAAVGLGAVGLASVAGFTQMAGADSNNHEPIVTIGEPHAAPARDVEAQTETPSAESPLDPIQFEQDPNEIQFTPDGEFYCPPCGMG